MTHTDPAELPWPEEWLRPSLGGWGVPLFCWFGAAFLGLLGTGMLVIGSSAADAGAEQVVAAVLLVSLAVVFGVLAWRQRPNQPYADVDHVRVDVDQISGMRLAVRPAGPLSARLFRLRRDPAGLVLAPEHLLVDLGVDRLLLSWNDVTAVDAAGYATIGRPRRVFNWILISTKDGHPDASPLLRRLHRLAKVPPGITAAIVHTRLATDPVLVYHALRFYLHHPDQRPELSDARAIDRLRGSPADIVD